jgi:hypothetical protein
LRGQIRMEETVELNREPVPETTQTEAAMAESISQTPVPTPPPPKADGGTTTVVKKKKSAT